MAVTRVSGLVGIALLICSRVAAATTFHIEPGYLTFTLNQFSTQAGIQLLFDFNELFGLQSPLVDCECTPREAMHLLLSNVPTQFEYVNDHTMAVTAEGERLKSQDLAAALRRFEYVAQPYPEGAGPPVSRLIRVLP